MDKTALKRGASALAMFAALATWSANANADVGIRTVTPADGANSIATLAITDTELNDVASFGFYVYFRSSEATFESVEKPYPSDTDGILYPADPLGGTPAENPVTVDPGDHNGFDRRLLVAGDHEAEWEDVGDLAYIKLEAVSNAPVTAMLEAATQWSYIDGNTTSIPYTLRADLDDANIPASPVIVSYTPEGGAREEGTVTVTVTGSGFYDGTGTNPATTVSFNGGAAVTPTYISGTEISFDVDASALTADTAYTFEVSNDSNNTDFAEASAQFYAVDRDLVYVDDDFTAADGAAFDTTVPFKVKGANAFANIQPAVNAVNVGQTVEVAGGTYAENNSAAEALLINKPLSLVGPNAGTDGKDSRSGEAVIVPGVQLNNDQEWSGIPVVNITSSNVTIDGFSISGDNAGIDGFDYADMNLEAGTAVQSAASNVSFVNNIVSDVSFLGFYSTNGSVSSAPGHHNVFVKNNLFEGITDNNTLGYGMAVYMQASTGQVNDNTFRDVRQAMQIQPYRVVADFGNGEVAEVVGNNMEAWRGGIYYNYAEQGASPWTISGNQIAACEPPSTFADTSVLWEGITIETMRDSGNGGTIDGNNINGSTAQTDASHDNVGVFAEAVWGIRYKGAGSTSNDVIISNNTVSNVTLGFVHDAPSDVTLTGNTFANFTDDAIRLQLTYGSTGTAAVNNSNENFGGTGNVDATGGNTYGTIDTADAGVTLDNLYDVEDVITHKVDNLAWGLVRVVPENIYVTQESNSIQRGVDAATVADTIHVQAGTYAEAKEIDTDEYIGLDVNKQVTLLGPNAGTAGNASRVTEAIIVPGQTLNTAGTLTARLYDEHPVVSISADGVLFDGFAVSGENSALSNPASFGGLNLSASTGINSKANNVAIQNNIVEKFSLIAIWSAGGYAPNPQYDNVSITQNLVQNIQSDAYGYGVYFQGSDGTISNNVVLNARKSMQIQPYNKPGTILTCSGNQLQAWDRGLYYNYTVKQAGIIAGAWTFANNVITACEVPAGVTVGVPTEWTGIRLESQRADANGGVFTGNSVDGSGSNLPGLGIYVMGNSTTTDKLYFDGNTISNVATGLLVTAPGAVQFGATTSNEISNSDVAIDIASAGLLNTVANNNIHDNGVGIRVRNGGIASINGNTLTGNAQQFAFEVSAANEAVVNTFNMQNLLAGNLEAVVAANTVTGKTYISAGMADTQGAVVAESVGGEQFTFVRNTIQGSIEAPAAVATNNTVLALADTYDERVRVNKTLRLQSAGATVMPDPTGPVGSKTVAIEITANGSIVNGFLVTRDIAVGNVWGTPALYTGIQIHQQEQNVTVENNTVTNYWNGIYLNDCPNNSILANSITNNRHGIQICNNVTGTEILNNVISDNWFSGIGFNEPGSTVLKTTALTIRDNSIAGNGAYEVSCDWVVAKTDVLDLSGNWFGTTDVTINTAAVDHGTLSGLEPGTLGDDVATIGGIAADRLIDYNAYLADGTDQETAAGFQGDFSELYAAASPLAGTEDSHISDAVALLADGTLTGAARLINVNEGIYEDGVANVDKSVQIVGIGDRAWTVFNPKAAGQNGIEIAASNVAIDNLTIAGDNATRYGTAIYRPNTGTYGNTTLNNLAVSFAGDFSTKKYAVDLRQPIAGSNLVSTVSGVTFANCDYAGLALFGGDVDVTGSSFTNMSYQGIYAAPAHATPGSTQSGGAAPVVTAKNNSFTDTPVSIRLNNVGAGSVIGGATADANTFTVAGAASPGYGMGVSIEGAPAAVSGNQFNLSTDTSTGVWVWDTAATVSGNTFTGSGGNVATGIAAVGLRTGDLAGAGRNYSDDTHVTATGNTFTGLNAGVVANFSADATQAVAITVNGSNTFENNHDGVLVDGEFATAVVNGNTFTNNEHGIDIAEATDASDFDSNTFEVADTSAQKYIVNNSGEEFFVGNNSFDGETPTSLNLQTETATVWNIVNGLVDELDINDGAGYLRLVNSFVFVPEAKDGDKGDDGLIQRAFNAAVTGDDVALQPGDFTSGGVDDGAVADKILTVETASLTERATVHHRISFEVPNAAGNVGISNVNFTGSGTVAVGSASSGTSVETPATIGFKNLKFEGLTGASLPTAIAVMFLNPTGDALEIDNVEITESSVISGISMLEARNAAITNCSITNNLGSGISIVKALPGTDGITPSDISITNCTISGNGVLGVDYDAWNNEAYGVLVASVGSDAELPFGQNISLTGNIITDNAATGVFLSGQDGATISGNVIESNGLYKVDEDYDSQNNDGLKINTSKNVTVTDNSIRYNGRNNVLVSAKATDVAADTENIQITFNHLEGNVEHPDGIGAALMLQLYNSPSDTVVATNNWWGHVYGPSNDALNETGRGAEIDLQGGTVDISNWYGIKDYANKWYQLNDQDGDGVWDADEDISLGYDLDAGETGLAVKDSDGDGYEDGAEVKLGSNPLDILSTPADPNGDGSTDDTHVLAPYANYRTTDFGNTDSDGDGYLDFYEVGQGTDPRVPEDKPTLGLLKSDVAGINAGQVSVLRRILVLAWEFTDELIEQDNADLNRDGIVNNVDLIWLRRTAANNTPLPIMPPPAQN